MGLLRETFLGEARAGPSEEVCYQDHRGCCEILLAFGVVKGAVYARVSQVFFILFLRVQICGRMLGLLKHGIRLLLGCGLYFLSRRENVAFQEDYIKS